MNGPRNEVEDQARQSANDRAVEADILEVASGLQFDRVGQ